MRVIQKCVKKNFVILRISKLLKGLRDVLKDWLSNNFQTFQSLFPRAELPQADGSLIESLFRDLITLPIDDLEKLRSQIQPLALVAMKSHRVGTINRSH